MANLISIYGQCDIPGFVQGYFQALPWKEGETYLKRSAIAREELRQALRTDYQMQGWDEESGRPTPARLA
ncbi:MAG: hypothetical protein FJY95_00395 [Candidatus Handelsmanbacteria bacterium]|nr:hypothetical protein [Candidatus Handelsmanbacteria bacterium]